MTRFSIHEKNLLIEELVLFIMLISSLIGMGITDVSPTESYRYWTGMILFYALASITLGWSRTGKSRLSFNALIFQQLFHWGGTLLTVSGIYFILQSGRMNYESTGLIIQLVLGFSLFLNGRHLGWRCSLLGLLVGAVAIVAAYVEEYLWMIILAAFCLAIIAFFWEKHRLADEK